MRTIASRKFKRHLRLRQLSERHIKYTDKWVNNALQ